MTANHQEAIPTTGYIRRCNLAKLLDTSVSTGMCCTSYSRACVSITALEIAAQTMSSPSSA